jgi:outer membrane protein N
LSICVFAFALPAIIAKAADAPQDVTAEDSTDSASTVSGTEETANAGTSDAPDDDSSEAEQRELQANENPMPAAQEKREEERPSGLGIYGSLRVRDRYQAGASEWQDGGSRIGADIDWHVFGKSDVYARYEAGFNVLTGLEKFSNPGEYAGQNFGDTFFTRLLYIGVDASHVNLVAGKNWSTYYRVSYFTDRFMSTGGSTSGTYNAQTDGGPTGPGRADSTLQTHFSIDFLPVNLFKPFQLNAQIQHCNPIPFGNGADYGTAVALRAILTTQNNFTLGLAYNQAQVDIENNPSLRAVGLSGDARAALVGTRAFGDRWYAGFVASRLENHETTNDGIYFDGWGSELYLQYRVAGPVWLIGGYNILEPDASEPQAGDYRLKYALAGFRYSFEDFGRMIFANVRIDDSLNADGTPGTNVSTIGIRWDLSKRGCHQSE